MNLLVMRRSLMVVMGLLIFGAVIHLVVRDNEKPESDRLAEASRLDSKTNLHLVSVNRDWGFVVLEGVDGLDLAENSKLEVVRDGDVLANLSVKVVEEHGVVAEILPGSFGEELRIVPGDLVR